MVFIILNVFYHKKTEGFIIVVNHGYFLKLNSFINPVPKAFTNASLAANRPDIKSIFFMCRNYF